MDDMRDAQYCMVHGNLLCERRVRDWPSHEPLSARQHYMDELAVRRFVMQNLHQAGRLQGVAKVWHQYMVLKADLDAARYNGLVDEATFRHRARSLRSARDRRARRLRGVPWLREEVA